MLENVVVAQLYTVRKFTQTIEGVAESLKRVADIGYSAVQISGFGPVDPKEVAKLVEDNGLTVASTHMNWERFLNDLDGVIEEHLLWKCEHPAIGGLFGEDYRGPDGVKRFVDELGPVAEKLAAVGMDFSYHNHNHEFAKYEGKTWLEMLFDATDASLLNFELDVYWVQAGGGDPAYWVEKCAGRQPLLHLKDMAVTPTREVRFAEIGEGNLNWPAILKAAAEGGVDWYCVEQDQCYERDPFDSLALSYRNLNAMGLT